MSEIKQSREALRKSLWDKWQELARQIQSLSGWVQNPEIFCSSEDIQKFGVQYHRALGMFTDAYTCTVVFATEECLGKLSSEKENASVVESKVSDTDNYPI